MNTGTAFRFDACYGLLPEPLPVLGRVDEGLDHLGFLRRFESIINILEACVIASIGVELSEPELHPCEVCVRRIIRITS